MVLLLAVLLAFLAQNLITPWPLDFAAVCGVLGALGVLLALRGKQFEAPKWFWIAALTLMLATAWQLLPSGLAAGLLFVTACLIFVSRTKDDRHVPDTAPAAGANDARRSAVAHVAEIGLVALIVAIAAIPALYDNAHIPPGLHGDEAESGLEARNLNAGKYDTLIGVGWYDQALPSFLLQALGLQAFGNDVGGLRTTSGLVSLATLPLVYVLTRRMFGMRVGLFALVLMAFAHWFIAYARIGINYNQTLLLEVLAIWAFWEGWQTRQWAWWVLCGLATGAGLYLYFASRLVPILLGAFAAWLFWFTRIRPQPGLVRPPLQVRQLALWTIVTLLVFAPMADFFAQHASEFNSRAAFVFLFSDSEYNTRDEKLMLYTGTDDVPTALAIQVSRYAVLFNVGGDHSGQYGNTLPLLDYYTGAFFVLGLAFALYRWREPRFMLLLLWLALTLFIGGVLTIESPFTPRIIGAMPVPFILAAVALDRLWKELERRLHGPAVRPAWESGSGSSQGVILRVGSSLNRIAKWAPHATLLLLFCGAIYFNYWVYFEHYIFTIDGWAQREPATAIAHYAAQMQPDQTIYVMSAPELYVWHGTIRFLAPQLRGFDLLDPANDLPVRDVVTHRASFVMLPNYLKWLPKLEELYPHGQLNEFRRPTGELWYTIYEVGADDIAARR